MVGRTCLTLEQVVSQADGGRWFYSEAPDRFNLALLRTLQRTVQKRRDIMASKLVYSVNAEIARDTCDLSELALSVNDLKG